jgi:hypothetical protein
MTSQVGERLIYEGHEVSMCSEPLRDFFSLSGKEPEFAKTRTSLWRRYVGTWEIVNDRLYLVGLKGKLEDGSEATLETVFPGYPDRVFAHWYSGKLRIPRGKILEYVHMGYSSIYERDHFLKIEKGVVVGCQVRQNSLAEEGQAPRWQVDDK